LITLTKWETTTDDELSQLALKWTTDKIKWYTGFYHSLLNGKRDAKKVLEIGIGYPAVMWSPETWYWPIQPYITGASVRMWEEYFPQAQVYALDINREILINEGRIQSYWFDQSDITTYPIEQIGTGFDFIVEDGSHKRDHQMTALMAFVPLLAPGGIYIAEDCGYMNHDELVQLCREIPYDTQLVEFHNTRLQGNFAACVVVRQ
jgi:hypothetical protein